MGQNQSGSEPLLGQIQSGSEPNTSEHAIKLLGTGKSELKRKRVHDNATNLDGVADENLFEVFKQICIEDETLKKEYDECVTMSKSVGQIVAESKKRNKELFLKIMALWKSSFPDVSLQPIKLQLAK